MKKISICSLFCLFLFSLLLLAPSQPFAQKIELRTSAQPCLHGFPMWYAEQSGMLKDAPFTMKFMLFASGAPQTEALAADQWDIGTMGTVPTMMASMRYGYKLIGISNEEAATNDIWVRPDSPLAKAAGAVPNYPDIYGNADLWKGKKILATTVSTGHYALTSTLKAMGLKDSDVNIVHMEQGQAMTAFNAGEGDILQLWAPLSYVAEAKKWVRVSSGAAAKVSIAGGIGVRKDFAEKHPDLTIAWLNIYMGILEDMKANPDKYIKPLLDYFNNYCGLELTEDMVKLEFKYRPLYTVSEQVLEMETPSMLPASLRGVAEFMLSQGRIRQKEFDGYVKQNFFIDASFMKKVAQERAAK